LKRDLRLIVQEPIVATEAEPFKNVKRLYQACTNVNAIEILGNTVLTSLVAKWPVVSGSPTANWTWHQSVVESRNAGYSSSYIFSFSVSSDNRNSTQRVIRVS
jgi:Peptidase family M13